MSTKIYVVGRHTGDLPEEYEVVGQEAVTFSLNLKSCSEQVEQLFWKAAQLGAKLVFQNIPGIVGVVLAHFSAGEIGNNNWGVIVSVPGERKAGVVRRFVLEGHDDYLVTEDESANPLAEKDYWTQKIPCNQDASTLIEAVKFVNARAKTTRIGEIEVVGEDNRVRNVIEITVDPVGEFVFSHIEWF